MPCSMFTAPDMPAETLKLWTNRGSGDITTPGGKVGVSYHLTHLPGPEPSRALALLHTKTRKDPRTIRSITGPCCARLEKKERNINSSRRGEGPRDVYPLSDSSLRYDSGGWAMGEGKITVLWLEKGWCTELGRPCVESNVSQSVFQGGAPCR
jgi:hypothetical protein